MWPSTEIDPTSYPHPQLSWMEENIEKNTVNSRTAWRQESRGGGKCLAAGTNNVNGQDDFDLSRSLNCFLPLAGP